MAGLLSALPAAASDLPWQEGRSSDEKRRDIADVAQPWTIQVEPMVWYAAPGGSLRMPGSPASAPRLRLEALNLDTPRVSPYGELHLRTGEWRFMLGSFAASRTDRGAEYPRTDWIGPFLVSPGDRITSSIEFSATEVNLGYRIPIPDALVGRGGREFRGSLEAIGGLRMYTLGFEIATPQGVVSHDELLFEPLLGLKYTMEIRERFNIDVQVSLGGYDDGGHRRSYSYDILSAFAYRPAENVGIQIGYRQLAYGLWTGSETEEFNYRGAVAGLFAGVLVRF